MINKEGEKIKKIHQDQINDDEYIIDDLIIVEQKKADNNKKNVVGLVISKQEQMG